LEWIADDEPDLTWSGKTFFIRASGSSCGLTIKEFAHSVEEIERTTQNARIP
jgi:hypothetical protein